MWQAHHVKYQNDGHKARSCSISCKNEMRATWKKLGFLEKKTTRINIFCYKMGCIKTPLKLVWPYKILVGHYITLPLFPPNRVSPQSHSHLTANGPWTKTTNCRQLLCFFHVIHTISIITVVWQALVSTLSAFSYFSMDVMKEGDTFLHRKCTKTNNFHDKY